MCNPAAADFRGAALPEGETGEAEVHTDAVHTNAVHTDGVHTDAVHTGAGSEIGDHARLAVLWPTAIYSVMLPAMEDANTELAEIVARRFGELPVVVGEPGAETNERFHDSHRPQLISSLDELNNCRRSAPSAVARCEEDVAARSVWPALLNSSAFRALFWDGGHVWTHLRRYLSHVSSVDLPARPLFSAWTTYQRDGIRHDSHSHDGSSVAGVYYVRSPGAEEVGGQLRLFDPRHIQLGDEGATRQRVTHSEHVIKPTPGMLVLWPAYLQHEVRPTWGKSPRVSLPIDFAFDRGATKERVWPVEIGAADQPMASDDVRVAPSPSASASLGPAPAALDHRELRDEL